MPSPLVLLRPDEEPLAASFRPALMSWWSQARKHRDDLPWRRVGTPWGVLLSEVMLVQTQATRVAERFPELYERYPSPFELAAASLGSFLQDWSGLGYNRRAVALHQAAGVIVEHHGGQVPQALEELLALPGVGDYIARAVLCFAHGKSVGVIDTNIGRVLARAICGQTISKTKAQALADRLTPPRQGRDWNLALMDLGSTICTSRSPRCSDCPVEGACAWRRGGGPDDPARGSSGVSRRQAAFRGSDREGRGKLMKAACSGPVLEERVAAVMGWPLDPERANRVVDRLLGEGLLCRDECGALCLPD